MKLSSKVLLLCALIGVIGWVPQLRAVTGCTGTLTWDGSSSPIVAGYAVYYGVSGSSVTNRVDAGLALTAAITGLVPAANYFFYVVVYDAYGDESPPSNELLYSTPSISPMQLNPSANGDVNIQFQVPPGATCSVEYTPSLNPPTWTLLTTAVGNASGLVSIDDVVDPSQPSRFYRGRTVSLPQVSATPTPGLTTSLRWNASLVPGTVGYTVYYGPVRSSVTNQLNVGSALSATINGLSASTKYFFYVAPYDSSGDQGPSSKCVLHKTPSIRQSQSTKLAKARPILIPWRRKS
ncbi:MAG TPA: fibronectin type III domain-containing protein [Verrucomicrobiae bacterium]|nr:fibronectin type III domain-containing protein [Verrucomicrobiae bacterium]